MRIIVTGFEPFGGEKINPSLQSVMKISDKIDGVDIIKLEVPTVFHKCDEVLAHEIEKYKPEAVISVGQAGGRNGISVEKIAVNSANASIPDNAGNMPVNEKLQADGKDEYHATICIDDIVDELRENGICANISLSAGTFVCNDIMYNTLYLAEKKYPHMKSGFIHVPYLPEQVINRPSVPSMTLDEIVKSLEIIIKTVINKIKNDNV